MDHFSPLCGVVITLSFLGDAGQLAPTEFVSAGPMTFVDFLDGTQHSLTAAFAVVAAGLTDGVDSTVIFGATLDNSSMARRLGWSRSCSPASRA